jgi:hypothetical protein
LRRATHSTTRARPMLPKPMKPEVQLEAEGGKTSE